MVNLKHLSFLKGDHNITEPALAISISAKLNSKKVKSDNFSCQKYGKNT
jgi:hypothetical protein